MLRGLRSMHWEQLRNEMSLPRLGGMVKASDRLFHPDGSTLASSSDDGIIKLWNIQTATCQRKLVCERPYVRMNITGIQGLTKVQKASLLALEAVEESQE